MKVDPTVNPLEVCAKGNVRGNLHIPGPLQVTFGLERLRQNSWGDSASTEEAVVGPYMGC